MTFSSTSRSRTLFSSESWPFYLHEHRYRGPKGFISPEHLFWRWLAINNSYKETALFLQMAPRLPGNKSNVIFSPITLHPWASYQIRKVAGCACAVNMWMPGTFFPATDFNGNRYLAIPACITARAWRTCVMHVGIAYQRRRGKRSWYSRSMRTRNFTYLTRGPCRDAVSRSGFVIQMHHKLGNLTKQLGARNWMERKHSTTHVPLRKC